MSLSDVWEGAAKSPYHPAVPKERQFLVAFTLLLTGKTVMSLLALQQLADGEFRLYPYQLLRAQ